MTRGLSSAEVAATAASHRIAAPLIEMQFRSGTVRLTLAPWDLTVGGETWFSQSLINIAEVRESTGTIEGFSLSLAGMDPTISALAIPTEYRGRICRLLKAHFDPSNNQIIDTPKAWFVGRMNQLNIIETNDRATVELLVEHFEVDLTRPSPIRLNDAHQQARYPGDLGAQFVERMAEIHLVWPDKQALR